jgi:hypothetical protein
MNRGAGSTVGSVMASVEPPPVAEEATATS